MKRMKQNAARLAAMLAAVIMLCMGMASCSEEEDKVPNNSIGHFVPYFPTRLYYLNEFSELLVHPFLFDPDIISDEWSDYPNGQVPMARYYPKIFVKPTAQSYFDYRETFSLADNPFYRYQTKGWTKETADGYETLSKMDRSMFYNEIEGIDVYTLEDFDDLHKAGSKLNDIIMLQYMSFYNYLKSGYKINEETCGNGTIDILSGEVDRDLQYFYCFHSDLNAGKLFPIRALRNDNFIIQFKSTPKVKSECSIPMRIELRDENGLILTKDFVTYWPAE